MKNLFYPVMGLLLMTVLPVSCRSRVASSVPYSYETQCMGIELDGSQTLKAFGMGRYRFNDAVDQAKKNAVRDVLFKGHFAGSGECEQKPLILEVNAQQKYRKYFNAFFADNGGEYKQFISLRDERIENTIFRSATARNGDQSVYSVIVRVQREKLREKLIQDGILKN